MGQRAFGSKPAESDEGRSPHHDDLVPSASSRGMLCQEFSLFTAKVVTHPLPELLRSQKPSWFDNGAFAMDPLGLDPVEPGAFGGQPAWNDVHTRFPRLSLVQNGLIVLMQPGSYLLTYVPGGILPNEEQHMLILRMDLLAQPL